MKKMIIIYLISIAPVYARTIRPISTVLTVMAPTEIKLLQKTQERIPNIRNFSDKQLMQFATEHSCRTPRRSSRHNNFIDIRGVDINKVYKVEGNFLIPYYKARVQVTLKKCREKK